MRILALSCAYITWADLPVTIWPAVAEQIKRDPFTWSEPVLGMSPATYADKMVKNTTWGGAIELAIISDLYKVEIDSVDVQSGRVDSESTQSVFPRLSFCATYQPLQ